MKRGLAVGLVLLLAVLVITWVVSCGGGNSKNSDFTGFTKTVNLGIWAQDIPLEAGTTWSLAFSVDLGLASLGGPYTSFMMDFADNLPGLAVSTLAISSLSAATPLATTTGTMTVHVAPVGAADPCTDEAGVQYGPFTVTLDDANQPESVSPSTASATQTTVDLINVGAFSICIEIESPVEADVSKGEATFTVCTEDIADMAGTWTGTFYCTGNCPIGSKEEPENVTLNITQTSGKPGDANYTDDGDGVYSGSVCGYTFSFEGGGDGYDESGIFTMDEGGLTAKKKSYYVETYSSCEGTCYDTLSRVVTE